MSVLLFNIALLTVSHAGNVSTFYFEYWNNDKTLTTSTVPYLNNISCLALEPGIGIYGVFHYPVALARGNSKNFFAKQDMLFKYCRSRQCLVIRESLIKNRKVLALDIKESLKSTYT